MLAEFPSGSTVRPAPRLFVLTCLQDATSAERHVCISSDSLAHSPPFVLSTSSLNLQYSSVWRFTFSTFLFCPHLHCAPMLTQYLSSVGGGTLSPRCNGSPSGTRAFKRVCLNLCQGLVVKTKSACFSVSRWNIDSISVLSNGPGQASVTLWGRSLRPCWCTIKLSGPALLMLRVTQHSHSHFFFFFCCVCRILLLQRTL